MSLMTFLQMRFVDAYRWSPIILRNAYAWVRFFARETLNETLASNKANSGASATFAPLLVMHDSVLQCHLRHRSYVSESGPLGGSIPSMKTTPYYSATSKAIPLRPQHRRRIQRYFERYCAPNVSDCASKMRWCCGNIATVTASSLTSEIFKLTHKIRPQTIACYAFG